MSDDEAKGIYEQGLEKVRTTPAPVDQKYPIGSFVKIADDLGQYMSHFDKALYAQIEFTYAHAYWGDNAKSYSLLVRRSSDRWSSVAWYYEHQLTLVTDADMIAQFNKELLGVK